MKVVKVIHAILSEDATVGPLVLEGGFYKVFPLQIKQGYSYPAIVVTPVSVNANETKTSASIFDQVRVQIDCYAKTYTEAATLDDAVRAALDRYNDGWVGQVENVTVKGISYINSNETIDEPDNVYRVSTDYQVIIDPS